MADALTTPISLVANILASYFPGLTRWTKWVISCISLFTQRCLIKKRFDLYDKAAKNKPYKLGFLVPPEEKKLESPYDESHLQNAADEVMCYGVNSKSECLVARVARCCNEESEAWIYLKLSNGKTYRLPESSSRYQQPFRDKCANFSCGGLQMYYITPMRRWRIFFNGFLRETSKENEEVERIVHVKFAFLWRASSDPYDFSSDCNIGLTAEALSSAKWMNFLPPIKTLHKIMNEYSQGGITLGTVKIGEEPEQEVYLWGGRMRYLGDASGIGGARFTQILGYVETGSIVHLGKISVPHIVHDLQFGFVVQSNGTLHPLQKCRIVSKVIQKEEEGCENHYVKFKAGHDYEMDVHFVERASLLSSSKGWSGSLTFNYMNLKLNDFKGRAILISGTVDDMPKHPPCTLPSRVTLGATPVVIELDSKLCQNPDLTGGKGSSLGKLREISKKCKTFMVPKGVVVTTAAYKEFLDSDIEKSVKAMESVAYGKTIGDLKLACTRTKEVVTNKKIPEHLHHAIEQSIRHIFGDDINECRFAVRSSATGEDTEQISAAGQMDTYLGLQGLEEVLAAIKKSWASQFGFTAVEYKRRYGQVLNAPMAVVVQEMVPCDVAGVLFTCDPLTGNPGKISISANYGLGETVVSGSSEPDMLILERNLENQLSLISTKIGDKSTKIIMDGSGRKVEESVDETKRSECCLSDEMALKLGRIALSVETSYRTTRDIEWGISNEEIFLLQSRPVTSITAETDFEIEHEQDGVIRSENEYTTKQNLGEVMPRATSPLGTDILMKFMDTAFQSPSQSMYEGAKMCPSHYYPGAFMPIRNHFLMNVIDMFYKNVKEEKLPVVAQALMVGVFSRILDDPQILAFARERNMHSKESKSMMIAMIASGLFCPGRYTRKVAKAFQMDRIAVEKFSTAREMYDNLTFRCSDLVEIMSNHMIRSYTSTLWNMLILIALANNKGEFNNEVYRDFAFLLSTCKDVESAEVPTAMQSLAFSILKDIDAAAFKSMDLEEAVEWLQNSKTEAGIKFRDFLSRHGHRCFKEFDIRSVPWGRDQKPLVKLLQDMGDGIRNDASGREDMNFEQVLSNLTIPLKFKYRWILKFLLPLSQEGVRGRESSKSLLMKAVDRWRSGYRRLSELMVMEGLIPDEDLLFFFTIEELDELLKTRSPRLILKANHRRKLFPVMDKYIFPEIMKGHPKPINVDTPVQAPNCGGDFMMKGVPVSQGVIRATVRVIVNLEEAASLKVGEILVTYGTDIGWTPYFPFLGGVITEIGGLVSHGAVVAREYGLPCVVGLHGATRLFHTGDYVLLDGNTGIVKRLSMKKLS